MVLALNGHFSYIRVLFYFGSQWTLGTGASSGLLRWHLGNWTSNAWWRMILVLDPQKWSHGHTSCPPAILRYVDMTWYRSAWLGGRHDTILEEQSNMSSTKATAAEYKWLTSSKEIAYNPSSSTSTGRESLPGTFFNPQRGYKCCMEQ